MPNSLPIVPYISKEMSKLENRAGDLLPLRQFLLIIHSSLTKQLDLLLSVVEMAKSTR